MRRLFGICLVASALAITLAACAPTTTGNSAIFPIVLATPASVGDIKAGSTTFIAVDDPFSAFGIPEAELDRVAPIDFSSKDAAGKVRMSSRRVDWFEMKLIDAPQGWTVKLDGAEVRRQPLDTTSDRGVTTVYYRNYVRFVYGIQVPAGAQAGATSLTLNAVAFGKTTGIPLRINVLGEAPKSAL
jgi:hypothetical protein